MGLLSTGDQEQSVPQSRALSKSGDLHLLESLPVASRNVSVLLGHWTLLPIPCFLRARPPGIPAKPTPSGNGFLMA